jgi:hypothetical protein
VSWWGVQTLWILQNVPNHILKMLLVVGLNTSECSEQWRYHRH